MIELFVFVVKLIGWMVLGILGLILGILLLVLFSAVCYRLDGKKEEGMEGRLCLTWLFHFVSVVLGYKDGIEARVKILGKTVWKLETEDHEEESLFQDAGIEDGQESEITGAEFAQTMKPEDLPPQEPFTPPEKEPSKKNRKAFKKEAEEKPPEEKKGLWERIRDKIAAWIEKLKFAFSEICGKLKQIEEKRQWLLERWDWLTTVVGDPKNQESVRLIFRQIRKIIRHILPRKGQAELNFGREDPYRMGKVLSYAGAAYPFTHKFLVLHPVFGEDCLEGEVHIRGKIRLGVILGYLLRLLFNQNIRQKLKEVWHGR